VFFTQILTRDLSRARTHSIRDAEVSPQQPAYPVILMRAGLAALTADYTSLAEDLASHGYIVVGFDAPYRTFVVVLPDGTVIARAPQNNADLFSGPEQEQLATILMKVTVPSSRSTATCDRNHSAPNTGSFSDDLCSDMAARPLSVSPSKESGCGSYKII
jgi:Platelet-activating factor acetylhydrolase, isoform II